MNMENKPNENSLESDKILKSAQLEERRKDIEQCQSLNDLANLVSIFGDFKNKRNITYNGKEQAEKIRFINEHKDDISYDQATYEALKEITNALGIRKRLEELLEIN